MQKKEKIGFLIVSISFFFIGGVWGEEKESESQLVLPTLSIDSTEIYENNYTQPIVDTLKIPLKIKEIPQSVSVITEQNMQDQNMQSMDDVMNSVVGISRVKYGYASDIMGNYNNYYSRGFLINNYQIDGVPTSVKALGSVSLLNMAGYDQVEIIRGSTGLLSGAGNPSASINLHRKLPTHEFKQIYTLQAGQWDKYKAQADIGGPLSGSGDIRGRLVISSSKSNSWIDRANSQSQMLYGVAVADLSDKTTMEVGIDLSQVKLNGVSMNGFAKHYSNGRPTHFSKSANASARWAYNHVDRFTTFSVLKHSFENGWKGVAQYSYSQAKSDYVYGIAGMMSIAPSGKTIMYAGKGNEQPKQHAVDLYLNGPFELFNRTHQLMIGTNGYTSKRDDPGYKRVSIPVNVHGWNGSVVKPNFENYRYAHNIYDEQQLGLYLASRFSITDRLSFILGGRTSDWKTKTANQSSRVKRKESGVMTPYTGIVYELTPHISLFSSYTTIFTPQNYQDTQGGYLKPLEGRSYEIGVKTEFYDGLLNTNLTFYQSKQNNQPIKDGDNLTPSGGQAYYAGNDIKGDGFEFEVAGQMVEDWHIIAGYTYGTYKNNQKKRVITDIPRDTFKLFTTYKLPYLNKRLTVGGGVNWQGKTRDSNFKIPTTNKYYQEGSYALVNALVRYQVNKNTNVSLNINNLVNKKYYTNAGRTASYGEPRNFAVTTQFTF